MTVFQALLSMQLIPQQRKTIQVYSYVGPNIWSHCQGSLLSLFKMLFVSLKHFVMTFTTVCHDCIADLRKNLKWRLSLPAKILIIIKKNYKFLFVGHPEDVCILIGSGKESELRMLKCTTSEK